MIENPGFWALLAAILTPGGIGFLWLRKKLKLSPDAAAAVAPTGPKPLDYDQALIALSDRLERQASEVTGLKIYIAQVVAWGHRGWAFAPAERREPLPKSDAVDF